MSRAEPTPQPLSPEYVEPLREFAQNTRAARESADKLLATLKAKNERPTPQPKRVGPAAPKVIVVPVEVPILTPAPTPKPATGGLFDGLFNRKESR